MKKAVILIIALLVAIPLLGSVAPNTVNSIRAAVAPEKFTSGGKNALLAVGRGIAGADEVYVSQKLPAPALPVLKNEVTVDFPLKRMVALNLMGFKIPVVLTEKAASPAAAQEEPELAETMAAVTAPAEAPTTESLSNAEDFLARQAVFSEYALPASVSCDSAPLPFEHVCPVSAEVTSRFGYRLHPLSGEVRFHYGTDFNVLDGHEIAAFADGTVETAGEISGYGNAVIINHADGYSTLYGHCSELLVEKGDAVTAGQIVALSGHSGQVTGPHMHFELRCNGLYMNPEFYI